MADYPKVRNALEQVGALLQKVKDAEQSGTEIRISAEERKFYDAYRRHWVHARERTVLTAYLCRVVTRAL